jgi:Arc/MetJ family transcription regulator
MAQAQALPLRLPDLPQVPTPRGARAAVCQMQRTVGIAVPRGSAYRAPAIAGRVDGAQRREPAANAALWYQQLHAGWMGARAPYIATDPRHPRQLLNSEAAELLAAAAAAEEGSHARGPDESLPPRRAAVTLLLPASVASANSLLLDGLAHWVSAPGEQGDPVVRLLRVTALAAGDAETWLKWVAGERTKAPDDASGTASLPPPPRLPALAVRWAVGPTLRTEVTPVTSAISVQHAVERLQQCVLALDLAHKVPLPATVYAPAADGAASGAFAQLQLASCEGFHAFLTAQPRIVLLPGCDSPAALMRDPIESIEVMVRERRHDALQVSVEAADAGAEHGVLLAPRSQRANACAHVQLCVANNRPLLPGTAVGLHLCIVRAQPRRFGPNITLYGPGGEPGQPTSEGGSSAWSMAPMIYPVDEALLSEVELTPCSATSALPGTAALRPAHALFFGHATRLYTELGRMRGDQSAPPSASALQAAERAVEAAAEDAPTRAVLNALRLDLHSKRSTVGDALAYLLGHGGGGDVLLLLRSAVHAFGPRTPLSTMLRQCARALDAGVAPAHAPTASQGVPAPADLTAEREAERLERVCNALLALPPPANAPVPGSAPAGKMVTSATAVRRLTRGCQLSKLREALLLRRASSERSKRDAERIRTLAVSTFAAGIFTPPGGPCLFTIEHCERLLAVVANAPAERWRAALMGAVRACIDVLLCDAAAPAGLELFLVYSDTSHTAGSAALVAERVVRAREYRPCATNDVLCAHAPRILAVQIQRDAARFLACA